MAFTKQRGSSAKVTIDGTDVSNAFRSFRFTSENNRDDVTGFSATGTTEEIPADQTQAFVGEAYYAQELAAIVQPLHANRTLCTISYQPHGLVDATREIYTGECYIHTFEAPSEVGQVGTFPFEATPGPGETISVSNWT